MSNRVPVYKAPPVHPNLVLLPLWNSCKHDGLGRLRIHLRLLESCLELAHRDVLTLDELLKYP